ncbi:hypothetical protein QQF64_007770 [Cirrhinus molitorella]|uniref:Secreted protein n=1 Tax=Cirrhinus molitorella TaxID=172907 RepID=A0ABR3MBN1_9TELE
MTVKALQLSYRSLFFAALWKAAWDINRGTVSKWWGCQHVNLADKHWSEVCWDLRGSCFGEPGLCRRRWRQEPWDKPMSLGIQAD